MSPPFDFSAAVGAQRALTQLQADARATLAGVELLTEALQDVRSPSGLVALNGNLGQTGTQAGAAAAGLNSMTKAAAGLTSPVGALTGGVVAMGVALRGATSEAAGYERALARVRAVTTATQSDIRDFGRDLGHVSTTWGVSGREAVAAGRAFRQAGQDGAEALRSVEAAAQASKLGFGSFEATSRDVGALARSLRLGAAEVNTALGSIHASASALGADAGTVLHDVARLGPALKSSGADLKEMAGLLSLVRTTAGEAGDALTDQLGTAILRLQDGRLVPTLKNLNVDLRPGGKFLGPAGSLLEIARATKGLDPTDPRLASLEEALTRPPRETAALLPALQKSAELHKALAAAEFGSSNMARLAAESQGTLVEQLALLQARLQAVGREALGQRGGLRDLVSLAVQAAPAFGQLAASLAPLVPALVAMRLAGLGGVGLAGLAGAGRSLLPAGGLLLGGVGAGLVGQHFGDRPVGAGLAGGAQLGLVGASVGSLFGPLGIALGLAVGGLYGFVSSLKGASLALQEREHDQKRADLRHRLGDLAGGSAVVNDANLTAVSTSLREAVQRADVLGLEQAKRSGVTGLGGLRRARADALRDELGGGTDLGLVVQRELDRLVSEKRLTPAGALESFKNSDLGRVAFPSLVTVSGRPEKEVEGALLRHADAELRAAKNADTAASSLAKLAEAGAIVSSLLLGVRAANIRADDLGGRGRLLRGAFSGDATGLPVDHAALELLGGPDSSLFRETLGRATGPLGAAGSALRRDAVSVDQLARSLPDIINQALASKPLGEGEGLTSRVTRALERDGSIQSGHREFVASALGRLSDRDLQQKLAAGAPALAHELLAPLVDPLKTSLASLGRELDARGNALVHAVEEYGNNVRKVMEEQHHADELRLAELRQRVAFAAQNAGVPGLAGDLVPFGAALAPAGNQLRRLTGLGADAGDPQAIAGRVREVLRQAEEVRQLRDQSPVASKAFQEAATELGGLQSEAARLTQALRLLADSSSRTADAQQRLNRIEQDRLGRLSLAERYVTAAPSERAAINHQLLAATQAARFGLGALPDFLRGSAIGGLNLLGESRIPALGGFSGSEAKNRLLENLFGGVLEPAKQRQRAGLQQFVQGEDARAVAAQDQLTQLLGALAKQQAAAAGVGVGDKFLSGMEGVFTTFLNRLSVVLKSAAEDTAKARLTQAQLDRGPIDALSAKASLLRAAGVDERSLPVLRSDENLARLRDYSAAARSLADLRSGRANLGRLGADFTAGASDFDPWSGGVFGRVRPTLDAQGRLAQQLTAAGVTVGDPDVHEILSRFGERFVMQDHPGQRAVIDEARRQGVPAEEVERRLSRYRSAQLVGVTNEVLTERASQQTADLESKKADLGARSGLAPDKLDTLLSAVVKNENGVVEALKAVDDLARVAKSVESIAAEIRATQASLAGLRYPADGVGPPELRRASGGPVPGCGDTDSQLAALTPGEFVLRKSSAQKIGYDRLRAMNEHGDLPHFADGGPVGSEGWFIDQLNTLPAGDEANAVGLDQMYKDSKKARPERRNAKGYGAYSIPSLPPGARGDGRVHKSKRNELALELGGSRYFAITPAGKGYSGVVSGRTEPFQGNDDFEAWQLEQSLREPTPPPAGRGSVLGLDVPHSPARRRRAPRGPYVPVDALGTVAPAFNGPGFGNQVGPSVSGLSGVPNQPAVVSQAVKQVSDQDSVTKMAAGMGPLQAAMMKFSDVAVPLTSALIKFSEAAPGLQDAIAGAPHSVEVSGQQEVSLTMNGAELLGNLLPEVQALVAEQLRAKVREVFSRYMPDSGVQVEV